MTGIGIGKTKEKEIECRCEIISLNAKGSEFIISILPEIPELEPKVREFLKKKLKDGKFKVKIYFPSTGVKFKINKNLLQSLTQKTSQKIIFNFDPFKIPGLIKFVYPEKEIWKVLRKTLLKAIKMLQEKRIKEGTELKKGIEKELEKIEENLRGMKANSVINEEILRIRSHLKAVRKILKEPGGPWGRVLDFYGQEILREANTITQKSEDINTIERAIFIKENAENIRELSRNLV